MRKIEEYHEPVTKLEITSAKIEALLKDLISENSELSENLTQRDKNEKHFVSEIKTLGKQLLTSFADKLKTVLVDSFNDAFDELRNILSYSLLSNANTRELAFGYGFTGAQAYGFDMAKQLLGVDSEEDLMYLNSTQRTLFVDSFKKYTEKYDSLYDSGFFNKYLEFQVEMQELKQDLTLEVVDFFMNNKDAIRAGMQALISIFEWLSNNMGRTAYNDSAIASRANEIINTYGGRNSTVRIDNSFNTTNANSAATSQTWDFSAIVKQIQEGL